MARDKESDQLATVLTMISVIILAVSCYYQITPTLIRAGLNFAEVNKFMSSLYGVFRNTWIIRGFVLLVILAASSMKIYRKKDVPMSQVIIWSAAGTALMLLPVQENGIIYTLTCLAGYVVSSYGYNLIFSRVNGSGIEPTEDTFLQTDELIESKDSVNIPYHYTFKGKVHHAWLNVVAPFRASLVLGAPGSGKTFAILNKYIEDMIRKDYCMFIYDYKFPTLTEEVLTEYVYQFKNEKKKTTLKPKLYILNFDDPMKSNRCNPIRYSYITDQADSSDIAETLFMNLNKGKSEKSDDFFNKSGQMFIDTLIYYLSNYDPDALYEGKHVIGSKSGYKKKGSLCTFPHIIELMAMNYKKVFQILQYTEGLEAKMSMFTTALEEDAGEQLAGQLASAQLPLARFVSPTLYWTMTGDDFSLDINNPDDPKMLCIGNSPLRQEIYGSTIALYTMQMFKFINQQGKLKSSIIIDELPSIFLKKLDHIINTARSNKVAMVLGAQDLTQLERDYGKTESGVIFGTVGTKFTGQVDGDTARKFSDILGKEFRERKDLTVSDDSDSIRINHQLEDIMPPSKIGTLSQGEFIGRIADDFKYPIKRKLIYGMVDVDLERNGKKEKEKIKLPYITDFFNGVEPVMSEDKRQELATMNPELAGNEQALYDLYKRELVQKIVNDNFFKVKKDVRDLVKKEFARTQIIKNEEKMRDNADMN